MNEDIPNGNFKEMITAKKLDLVKKEATKRIVEYIDLVFLENKMLVNATAAKLAATRVLIDVPIGEDIEDLKRIIYGDKDDPDEKTGVLNKTNRMFRDYLFTKRMIALIWGVFGSAIVSLIVTIIILFVKLIEKGF